MAYLEPPTLSIPARRFETAKAAPMRFSNAQLEGRFLQHENTKLADYDGHMYVFYAIVYFLGYLLISLREG